MDSSETAIVVEDLSKQYQIGRRRDSFPTLRDSIARGLENPFRHLWPVTRDRPDADGTQSIWALRDVSFEIKRGEVVGLVGRNGAGKSTLLKILSRITAPTHGWAQIHGRIGSMLEVGTGFHPELTGRENLYLNGSILGMKRAEIARKFDDIVDFSGVATFIDTPVKHYSSGMYVRLAFAVAAHLEPDILIVDEVLAVGDIDFQKKCIGSMDSVARSGRTVVIVSHNLALVDTLCTTAIWLDNGRVRAHGPTEDVLAKYTAERDAIAAQQLSPRQRNTPPAGAQFSGIHIWTPDQNEVSPFRMGSSLMFCLQISATQRVEKPWIGIQIRTQHNLLVFHMANREAGYELPPLFGDCEIRCTTGTLNLLPGRYYVDLILGDMTNVIHDESFSAASFDIRCSDVWGTGMPMEKEYGLAYFDSTWEMRETPTV